MLNKCSISGFADEIDKSLDVQIDVLHKLGQKYIEFRGADGYTVGKYTIEQAKDTKARLDEAGIKVSAIGSPVGKIQITDDFTPHFEDYKRIVEIAKIMDTKYIRMFSFFIPEGEDADQYKTEVCARLEKFIEYAKEQNVVLLHENEKDIYGDVAYRCLNLMKKYYGDHFKCVFDFANFVQCKQNTLEAYEILKDYVSYIHVKDAIWETGEVVVPGTGDGDLKKIFALLDKAGYEGFLSLEPHLVNFGALGSLEKNAAVRKLTDGAAAYAAAHNALIDMLA
ncbi:MAG: sugar phosphate isomerase/epimerase [Lachnospiraceae bacterium]|nr:sugar phosphate isomerase/epimerase [Lachnospiraceae bacterium]